MPTIRIGGARLPSSSLGGQLRSISLGGARAPISSSEPVYDPFFGVEGGVARYDARSLQLSEGDPVESWGDLSGQIGAAVQDVAARRPVIIGSGEGVGVRFSGGSHLLLPDDVTIAPSDPITVFAVITREVRNASVAIVSGGGTNQASGWIISQISGGQANGSRGGVAINSGSNTAGNIRQTLELWGDGAVHTIAVDGVELAVQVTGSNPTPPGYRGSIGGLVDLAGDVATPWTGVMHHLVIFDRALSDAERNVVRSGLLDPLP